MKINCVIRNEQGKTNINLNSITKQTAKQTPWPESAIELYRPSDRRLSTKLLPTCVDMGRHVVSLTNLCFRILGFLDRSRYFSIK
jgi:hypothetical protein